MKHRAADALSPFRDHSAPLKDAQIRALEDRDRSHLWKPFTQMAGYVEGRPLIIEEGKGNWLRDIRGRSFLDGVSSLWVNVHGHAHPHIVARVREQLDRLDHATLLGPSNVPAVELASRLVEIAPGRGSLSRVFFSDSGSSAVEIAVKMAFQYFAQPRDRSERTRSTFVSMKNAYHGDTLGSVSVGGIDLFHQLYEPLLFETCRAPAPDPYHEAFGRDPAEHEAECLAALQGHFEERGERIAALVMEPLMQGAAGMLRHSTDFLSAAAALARRHGALLILDEVATGFGRSGTMFACDQAGVTPDLLCLAKGITGGVLPLAATLATEEVYSGFLGDYSEYRTFFHGHSYTGNPLACAAALASLEVFEQEGTLLRLESRLAQLESHLLHLAEHPQVGDVRRLGVMTGIELVQDKSRGTPWPAELRVGNRVAEAALERGVLIRPLGDVVVLMPPLSITEPELDLLCAVVAEGISSVMAEL
ncbi:MAG: adenosylmethionine--8-amino-7-oxononanoate transaminase [Myxococcota bacterium]|nr:adenosylmethionine--8-amino-7-oxononanoate transaminase [Myxococcota bacterium]